MAKTTLKWMRNTNPERAASLCIRAEDQNGNRTGSYPPGVFVVNSWSEETLAKKLASVDRKLAKHGHKPCEPVSFEMKTYVKTEIETLEDGRKRETPVAKFRYMQSLIYIEAAKIQIGDRQQVVGTIERVGDSNDVVVTPKGVPSDDVEAVNALVAEVGREIRCDHCRSNRRRNMAYVLRNQDGSLFMVAASCAKEYFGQNVAGLLSDLIDVEEKDWHGPLPLDRIEKVAITVGTILKHGFVSNSSVLKLNEARREAGLGEIKTTTEFVGEIDNALTARGYLGEAYEDRKRREAKTAEAKELVAENRELALQVIEDISEADPQDAFQANVQAVIRSMAYAKDWWKNAATVVAGVASYLKSEGFPVPNIWEFAEAQRRQERESKPQVLPFANGFIGNQGDKVEFACVVEGAKPYQSNYGSGYVFIMRTRDNHKVIYFGNAKAFVPFGKQDIGLGDIEVGTDLHVFGTISKLQQDTFKGVTTDVTVINRPTFRIEKV